MMNRSSAVYTTSPKATLSRKRSASVSTMSDSDLAAELLAKFFATLRRGLHRGDNGRLDPGFVERCDRALGRPALRGDLRAQNRRLGVALLGQADRAGEGGEGEPPRLRRCEPHLARSGVERLEEIEHVRRSAARYRGHRIEGLLELAPQYAADGLEHARRARAAFAVYTRQRVQAGDPRTDQRRGVRHRPYEPPVTQQPAGEIRQSNPRGDGQHHLPLEQRGQLARDG